MTKTVDAIYEHGVLRLLEALPLTEGTRVEVIIIGRQPTPGQRTPAQILVAIAALPTEAGGEEFSGRDHDRILYGDQDKL